MLKLTFLIQQWWPVEQPACSKNSVKSLVFFWQQVQYLSPSWNTGIPGWYLHISRLLCSPSYVCNNQFLKYFNLYYSKLMLCWWGSCVIGVPMSIQNYGNLVKASHKLWYSTRDTDRFTPIIFTGFSLFQLSWDILLSIFVTWRPFLICILFQGLKMES